MVQMPKLDITQYLYLALRRKWWIVIPFVLSLTAALAFLVICPRSYRANTLVLLEPQSIPDAFVRSTVTESMEGRLRTIKQQIHSRTNLEQIVHDFHLAGNVTNDPIQRIITSARTHLPFLDRWDQPQSNEEQNDDRLLLSKLVDSIREKLEVSMRNASSSGPRGQSVAFEISFEWDDADVVAPVTNTIASRFIQENLNAREESAISTTDFLEKETSNLRVELEAREKELENFKREHMGMLPDELQSNLSILNQLGQELNNLERRLEAERQQSILLMSQSHSTSSERAPSASTVGATRQSGVRISGNRNNMQLSNDELTTGNLEELENQLQKLSSQYTEKHPDIIALKRRIEALQKEGRRAEPTSPALPFAAASHSTGSKTQLALNNSNIESLKRQIQEVEKQIQIYKQRVERIPQVEMELNKITRDYQTVRRRYDDLLAKKLDAKLAEEMERKKKGEQFRVLDLAVKPPMPFKPNIPKTLAMAILMGLGLGCGLAYLRESLDPCFYSPEDIESSLGVPVIVSVPMDDNPEKAKQGFLTIQT
jgi:polysaccharide chain length determinant protein (PEP-CTERM system associated)